MKVVDTSNGESISLQFTSNLLVFTYPLLSVVPVVSLKWLEIKCTSVCWENIVVILHQKDGAGEFRIGDSVSCTCHLPSGVDGSGKYSFSVSFEADVCIDFLLYFMHYIVGVSMCVLLVLELWCPLYASTRYMVWSA